MANIDFVLLKRRSNLDVVNLWSCLTDTQGLVAQKLPTVCYQIAYQVLFLPTYHVLSIEFFALKGNKGWSKKNWRKNPLKKTSRNQSFQFRFIQDIISMPRIMTHLSFK